MKKKKNHLGTISVSNRVFERLAQNAAVNCFGVAGMAGETEPGRLSLLAIRKPRAVTVTVKDNALWVDLHVLMAYGVNISAIVQSIVNKVSYQLESATGIPVKEVNVYVDGLRTAE